MKKLKTLLALLCIGIAFSFTIKDLSSSAYYPGGQMAMDNYFIDSVRYPAAEFTARKEDIIRVTFSVSEKGVACNPQLTSLFDGSVGFEEEVKRLIADMPKWNPATDSKGKPTSSHYHSAVVRFVLPDSVYASDTFPPDQNARCLSFAEVMPTFQGGEDNFQTYLKWTIRYPQMEKEQGKDGTVYIYFEVAPSGNIENVKCQKGVPGAPGLAKEAIRTIDMMPRWTPGRQDGKPVRVGMTVPIRFILQ